jgi:hypothetical protein
MQKVGRSQRLAQRSRHHWIPSPTQASGAPPWQPEPFPGPRSRAPLLGFPTRCLI